MRKLIKIQSKVKTWVLTVQADGAQVEVDLGSLLDKFGSALPNNLRPFEVTSAHTDVIFRVKCRRERILELVRSLQDEKWTVTFYESTFQDGEEGEDYAG